MISQRHIDLITNALSVGMALEDACVYAALSPAQIAYVMEDETMQGRFAQVRKQHEYRLLNTLDNIIETQQRMGKEGATTWLLERINPRYSGKPQDEKQSIHLHFNDTDPEKSAPDIVTIARPKAKPAASKNEDKE